MKRIISLLMSLLVLSMPPVCAAGKTVPVGKTVTSEGDLSDADIPLEAVTVNAAVGQQLDIRAKAALLMEPRTGRILYESNPDEQLAPASITKIMSLLLVMEAIERGALTLETVITASEHACSMGGSQIWLEPNETMTVNELLKAAVIASANDATVALGEAVAGSEEGFVAQMNGRASELGMLNTHFVNCTGLDAEGHLTSAHDVAVMASALIKHPLIKNYSTVWMDTLRDGKSELVNTNKLVRFYNGTTGLKTGTTGTAGYCLAATAERDGMELVAVVMNGATSQDRFNGAKKLLDYGYANYSFQTIKADIDENMTVAVEGGTEKSVSVVPYGQLDILLLKSDTAEIKRELVTEEGITAPVEKGLAVGRVIVTAGEEQLGVIPLVAAKSVGKLTFGVIISWILKGMFTL